MPGATEIEMPVFDTHARYRPSQPCLDQLDSQIATERIALRARSKVDRGQMRGAHPVHYCAARRSAVVEAAIAASDFDNASPSGSVKAATRALATASAAIVDAMRPARAGWTSSAAIRR